MPLTTSMVAMMVALNGGAECCTGAEAMAESAPQARDAGFRSLPSYLPSSVPYESGACWVRYPSLPGRVALVWGASPSPPPRSGGAP